CFGSSVPKNSSDGENDSGICCDFISIWQYQKAIKKLAGIDTSVPMTEPDDIFRMLTSGMPCSFNTMACSTIGAAMTPPGMPATATGMESVSFLATMADMKNARMTYGDSPTSASAM